MQKYFGKWNTRKHPSWYCGDEMKASIFACKRTKRFKDDAEQENMIVSQCRQQFIT